MNQSQLSALMDLLRYVGAPQEWHKHALCTKFDADEFFPEQHTAWQAQHIKQLCLEHCPVHEQCRESALKQTGTIYGIWGGLSGRELMKLRHQQGTRCTWDGCAEPVTTRHLYCDDHRLPARRRSRARYETRKRRGAA